MSLFSLFGKHWWVALWARGLRDACILDARRLAWSANDVVQNLAGKAKTKIQKWKQKIDKRSCRNQGIRICCELGKHLWVALWAWRSRYACILGRLRLAWSAVDVVKNLAVNNFESFVSILKVLIQRKSEKYLSEGNNQRYRSAAPALVPGQSGEIRKFQKIRKEPRGYKNATAI